MTSTATKRAWNISITTMPAAVKLPPFQSNRFRGHVWRASNSEVGIGLGVTLGIWCVLRRGSGRITDWRWITRAERLFLLRPGNFDCQPHRTGVIQARTSQTAEKGDWVQLMLQSLTPLPLSRRLHFSTCPACLPSSRTSAPWIQAFFVAAPKRIMFMHGRMTTTEGGGP